MTFEFEFEFCVVQRTETTFFKIIFRIYRSVPGLVLTVTNKVNDSGVSARFVGKILIQFLIDVCPRRQRRRWGNLKFLLS